MLGTPSLPVRFPEKVATEEKAGDANKTNKMNADKLFMVILIDVRVRALV